VIEDEPLIALDLGNELEAAGAHVICARSPQTACQAIDHQQMSAAVVDFRLGSDGAEAVVARLRTKRVPYVFYTGFPTDALKATAPVVDKPAPLRLVVETLAQVLRRS
jgi:DNA-binding response OmpR family regulator